VDAVHFKIRHFDGRVEELTAESPTVLIGTGSHCEIRLPIGQARVEHVLIQATPAGLRAAARSFDPPPTLDGVEFTQVPLTGQCDLVIGKTTIHVSPSTGSLVDGLASGGTAARNPRLYAYVVFGLLACGLMIAARGKGRSPLREPATVPSLWNAAADRCPQADPDEAFATATARLDLALAKRERAPFHPEDGVAAVPLYEVAAACFRAAGSMEDAEDAAAASRDLQRRLREEFREHRVRLQRALVQQEWPRAEREAAVVSTFLVNAPGEYSDWLANLRRKLRITEGGKSKS
jgi:hypothetical protein